MLFTESQLRINSDPLTILDEATYIPEEEALIHPCTIPVMESSLGVWKIPYQSLNELCENHGIGLLDAFISVCECNQIDPSTVVMSVDEADIIEYPELIDESVPFVIAPISPYDPIYKLCEAALDEWLEIEDDSRLLEMTMDMDAWNSIGRHEKAIKDDLSTLKAINRQVEKLDKAGDLQGARNLRQKALAKQKSIYDHQVRINDIHDEQRKKHRIRPEDVMSQDSSDESNGGGSMSSTFGMSSGNSSKGSSVGSNSSPSTPHTSAAPSTSSGMGLGKKAAIGAGVAAAIGGGLLAYKQYQNRPKSVIAKKIASLRSIYQKWMAKAQSSKDSGIAAKLKRGAAKILQVIDKLMAFLQRKADHR